MHYKWLGNGFARDFILVPACVSLGSLIFCGGMLALMKDFKPIANLLKKWGIDPTTLHEEYQIRCQHPHLYEDVHAKRFGAKEEDSNGFEKGHLEYLVA